MGILDVTPVSVPKPNPYNVEALKHYAFNQTGNILAIWTGQNNMPPPINGLFNQTIEFYMTLVKKIGETLNPNTKKPYSIYNYQGILKVINEVRNFEHINEEDVSYRSNSWGANYSKELIEALIGLPFSASSLNFAQSLFYSIGQESLEIEGRDTTSGGRLGNIIFICEYLYGISSVSALVMSCAAKEAAQIFRLGPCFKEQSSSTELTVHKDMYLFNPITSRT